MPQLAPPPKCKDCLSEKRKQHSFDKQMIAVKFVFTNMTEIECPALVPAPGVTVAPPVCYTQPVFGNSCMFSCLRPGFRVEPFGNAFVSCEGGGRWSHDVLEIRCVGKWTLDSAGIDFQEIFCVIFQIGHILGAHNLLGLFSNSKICWLISETCIFTDIHHMCLSCSTHIPTYTYPRTPFCPQTRIVVL